MVLFVIIEVVKKRAEEKEMAPEALDTALLLITVPKEITREEDKGKTFKDFVAVFSQMLTSLPNMFSKPKMFGITEHTTFEIVAVEGQISFYMAVRREDKEFVQKQINAFYPESQVEEAPMYNLFKAESKVAGAELALKKNYTLPLRTYEELDVDAMASITNALNKLGEDGSGAIQFLVRPAKRGWQSNVKYAIENIRSGKSIESASAGKVVGAIGSFLAGLVAAFSKPPEQKEDKPVVLTSLQEEQIKRMSLKAGQVGYEVVVRVLVTSGSEAMAEANLGMVVNAFSQFGTPESNSFKVEKPKNMNLFVRDFMFRFFLAAEKPLVLSCSELATLFHFPNTFVDTPNIRWLLAKRAEAPSELPLTGTFMGTNIFRGVKRDVFITEQDRRRHVYTVGQTGTGKSTLMRGMIMADIYAGHGVCVVDPHGELIENVLEKIPKERAEDVILFDPGDTERPLGFNLLEYSSPEQRDFVVQESVSIFYKLFGAEVIGPKFEHWLRNGILTLMDAPDGGTIIEIPRLFSDLEFQKRKVANVTDPVVRAFWNQEMAATSDFHKSEMLGYFISKFGRFLTNEMMRNIIGQAKSAFDIRTVMDRGKILLVNLSKGKMGEVNSSLLGLILVSKIQMAAMSRVDIPESERRDFYLYIDEFQNFTTDSIAAILSEARKYHLNLIIAHQFMKQLTDPIRDAVLGNVGTTVCFRVGEEDAELLARRFEPVFSAYDLVNIENLNAYVKLLVNGSVSKPFSMFVPFDKYPVNAELGQAVRQLSRLKYGRDKEIVALEVQERTKID